MAENNHEVRQVSQDVVFGRNPVAELLKSGSGVEKIFIAQGLREGGVKVIAALARERKIPVVTVPRPKLDQLCGGGSHQGVAAISSGIAEASLEDVLQIARDRGEKPLVVICDNVNDPHNLGAIIRCCEGAGAHGVVIPKRHGAPLNAAAVKASAGAAEHIPVCRVSNLADTVDKLKKAGLWIFGCEAGGSDYLEADFTMPSAIVMGSEGSGISRLVKDKCDFVISLPMMGKVNSLNVSCASAVVLYRALAVRSGRS